MRVYVAGPIAIGDPLTNVYNAIDAAEILLNAGHTPFVPHLDHWWHARYPHTTSQWLKWDFEWLLQCEALVRLPGISVGADEEVEFCGKNGIPVYFGLSNFLWLTEVINCSLCFQWHKRDADCEPLKIEEPQSTATPDDSTINRLCKVYDDAYLEHIDFQPSEWCAKHAMEAVITVIGRRSVTLGDEGDA